MARSEEAILRRALKRQRTEGEQRYADRIDMNRQALKMKKTNPNEFVSNERQTRSNHAKDGSKKSLISNEIRRGKSPSMKKRSRHDEETSKKLVWARQADSKTLSVNQELRQRYRDTGGLGMSTEDLERAKLLIARDKRKQEKKKKKSQKLKSNETNAEVPMTLSSNGKEGNDASTHSGEAAGTEEPSGGHTINAVKSVKKKKSSIAQAKQDKNKALRLLYAKTGGKGMKTDQIERAKLLVARDAKKRKRRAQTKGENIQ